MCVDLRLYLVFLFLLLFVFYEVEVNDWIIDDNVRVNFRFSQAFIGTQTNGFYLIHKKVQRKIVLIIIKGNISEKLNKKKDLSE